MKFKKGVELPMNTLVVVAIAVIILLAMTAFFIGGFAPTGQDIQLKQDFQRWCNKWVQVNCDPENSIVNNVFKAYKKWTQKWETCEDLNVCPEKDKIISELQSACGCWFIAPRTPEKPVE